MVERLCLKPSLLLSSFKPFGLPGKNVDITCLEESVLSLTDGGVPQTWVHWDYPSGVNTHSGDEVDFYLKILCSDAFFVTFDWIMTWMSETHTDTLLFKVDKRKMFILTNEHVSCSRTQYMHILLPLLYLIKNQLLAWHMVYNIMLTFTLCPCLRVCQRRP